MAKLITYAYLRTECDISQNIEDKYLDNPIKRAMVQLKFLLGVSFYNELVSQNAATFTANNSAFFDPYVKQFLAWQAHQYWIIKANSYPTKIGIRVFKEDNSDPASDKAMGELIRDAKEATNQFQGVMLSFLKASQSENANNYPLYTNNYKSGGGGGFHITAITKNSTTSREIDNEIFGNG